MSRQVVKSFKLGNGLEMPAIGLGTWQSKKGEVAKAVQHALQNGYRHIDGAFIYANERECGDGIRQSGVPRKDIFLTTKLWHSYHRPEHVEKNLDISLKNFGTDYVDLYLIHFPIAFQAVERPDGRIPAMPKDKDGKVLTDFELSEDFMPTWRAMEQLVKKGKARHIGVCNWSRRRLAKLLNEAEIPPAVLQIELGLTCHTPQLVKYAQDRDIVVQAYSPLGSTGAKSRDNAVVQRIAQKHNCDPAQVLISWPLAKGLCVLPKSVTPSRIDQNLQTVELSADEVAELDKEAARTPRKRAVPDSDLYGIDVWEDEQGSKL